VVTMDPGESKIVMGGKEAELSPEEGAKKIFESM